MPTNGLRVPVLTIFLGAVACVPGTALAGPGGAGTVRYEDMTLGVAIALPEGWQVHRLDTDGSSGWQLGFASPESLRDAKHNGQPSDNPRYQDVLLERLPRPSFPNLHADIVTMQAARRRPPIGPSMGRGRLSASAHAPSVVTSNCWLRRTRYSSAHSMAYFICSAEARDGSFGPARQEAFEQVLRGLRIAKDAPSATPVRRRVARRRTGARGFTLLGKRHRPFAVDGAILSVDQ